MKRRILATGGLVSLMSWGLAVGCMGSPAEGTEEDLSSQSAALVSSAKAGEPQHATHTAASGGAGAKPFIDESTIPIGEPGFAEVRVKPTSEQPGPSDGTGAFRTVCSYSHMNFDDPLVFPGKEGAAHLHTFFGNTETDAFSTAKSLRNEGNSTCRGGIANRSAYWVPSLIDANGVPQKPAVANIYYKTGYAGIAPQSVVPFPEGLRMIAGDPKATAKQDFAYWGCSDRFVGHVGSVPDCSAGSNVIMTIEFPQCWDGKNLDSADHRSHMAYPVGGSCPSSHPVAIPAITFQVNWPVPPGGTTGFRLTSDMYDPAMPGGFSAHGDWFEAWDPKVVAAFVQNCNNPAVDCHSHLLGDGREIY